MCWLFIWGNGNAVPSIFHLWGHPVYYVKPRSTDLCSFITTKSALCFLCLFVCFEVFPTHIHIHIYIWIENRQLDWSHHYAITECHLINLSHFSAIKWFVCFNVFMFIFPIYFQASQCARKREEPYKSSRRGFPTVLAD